jgi:hypothetical protein
MSHRPLFTPGQLSQLLSQTSISSEQPWCTNDERSIDEYYRDVCEDLMRATGASSRIEWNHYGSGYASFIDAWFYKPTPEFSVPDPVPHGEEHFGLVVLLSRLSPYFVFMQSHKHWHGSGGSSYLPAFEAVDELSCSGVLSLAEQVQPLLEGHTCVGFSVPTYLLHCFRELLCPRSSPTNRTPNSMRSSTGKTDVHAMTPNPSIERTCPGKPGHAAHVER